MSNSVEMHLLHDCEDLLSVQRKLVSDVIDGIQANLPREHLLFGKLAEKFDASASALSSRNCFEFPSLLLYSTRLGRIMQ